MPDHDHRERPPGTAGRLGPRSRSAGIRNASLSPLHRRDLVFGLFAAIGSAGFGGDASSPFSTELITFSSRGRRIRAVLFRPAKRTRQAGVVYMHGSGSIGPLQVLFAQKFASDGYLTIVPTYLDAAADDIVRPSRVMNAWRDCGSDAVNWLIAEGIDAARTAIIGYSLGSHIAVDGALGDSRAGAAIGIAGGWDVYVPRRPARRIPVMLIQAENDGHVRPISTERWRRFLEERGVSVQMRVVTGAGHLFRPSEWEEVFAFAQSFLETRMG